MWHVVGVICTIMLLTNGWIYFRLTCAGLHPPWPPPHPPGDWWWGRLSREQRIWYPTWFCKTDAAAAAKNGFITAPNCRKVTDAMIEDFCDLIEWNCCYYIPFIRSTLSIWPLHCCYCTSHIVRVFANIRLSPECDGSQGSLRYYESSRRVFSLGSVAQNTVIIIVQPPVQHWAVSSRAVNEPSRSFTVPGESGDHQTVCWL